jgi:hypothetical protein
MRCPRCKKLHDILGYVPFKMIEEFASETTPVYKCPTCLWIFAPAQPVVLDVAVFEDDEETREWTMSRREVPVG